MMNIIKKHLIITTLGLIISLCSFISYGQSEGMNCSFNLHVKYKEASTRDTLVLMSVAQYFKATTDIDYMEQKAVRDRDGYFNFYKKTELKCGYWWILVIDPTYPNGRRPITKPFFWESGDSITLILSNIYHKVGTESFYSFIGKGANKYTLRYKIDSLMRSPKSLSLVEDKYAAIAIGNSLAFKKALKLYDSLSLSTSLLSRDVLLADQFLSQGLGMFSKVQSVLRKNEDTQDSREREELIRNIGKLTTGRDIILLDSNAVAISQSGPEFILYALKAESLIRFGKENTVWIFKQIQIRYTGILHDSLIVVFLLYNRNEPEVIKNVYPEAKASVRNKNATEALARFKHLFERVVLGSYVLTNSELKKINFQDYRGKIILVDFWFTGCGYCTIYYKNCLSKIEEEFKNDKDVIILSICLDKEFDKWRKSIASNLYTSVSAINVYTNGLGWQHPVVKENLVVSAPTVILVDKDGIVSRNNSLDLYNVAGLRTAILELKNRGAD